ncbi:MAG: nucleotidyltransferase [Chloroflexi bacterium]|nr:nucleotidyltransferase [Chloroflexota bacterium]HCU80696.1 nucleotidyltransferase [Chloroflexota bacterium]|tara:strand:- start:295 stop:1284 length:990 start_codon:yes stop_codon:yes gene_type:complete
MKIIIPLAGFGSRLRPHTFSRPKPLMNVAGTPVIGHVLNMFKDMEVEEFIFITGYMGDQIQEHISKTCPNTNVRFLEQQQLDGQSPAILLAKDFVNGPVLIGFADTIVETDLATINTATDEAIAWVKQVPDPRRFGVVVKNSDGYVTQIIEKPESMNNNLAVVGFYYLRDSQMLMSAIEQQINNDAQTKGEYYLADAMQILLDQGLKMQAKEVEIWKDCGKPESLLETNKYLLEHGHDNSPQVQVEGFVIVPPVNIHVDAKITNSVIGPHATIGADCIITSSIIRDSIIEQGTQIEDTVLTQSLIGRYATVKGKSSTFNIGDQSEVGFE